MVRRLSLFLIGLAALPALALAEVQLDVSDGPEELAEDLRAASLLVAADENPEATTQDVIAAARADYARLVGVLYENGYFGPVVSIRVNGREAANLSPFSAPSAIRSLDIRVNPGRSFTFGRAEIGPLAPGETPPEGFRSGEAAATPVLREAAEAGITGWRQAGHATAAVTGQQITARQAQAILDAQIRLNPGPRVQFGELIPQGHVRMREDRIREIAGLPTGEVFDPEELDRAAERLRRTGTFRSVSLEERPPDANDVMDIAATLPEAPLRRFGLGAEIASSDGATLSGYWLHRNLRGGAERLRFDAEISGLGGDSGGADWSLAGRYERPGTLTPDTNLVFEADLQRLDESTFTEDLFEVQAGFDHIFSDQLDGSIRFGLRISEIEDGFGSRRVTLATVPIGLTYDSRDNALDARRGYYAELGLTPFLVLEGTGDGGGLRSSLDARAYLGLGPEARTRLAGRVQLGSVDGGDITDLPPDFLFYSGGGGTVRGQPFRSLGAVQNGVASGGRGFAGLSAEIRTDLNEQFGLVAFADGGYVTTGSLFDSGSASEWHAGAGLGLRYNTAIGPIRLDVATPVSGDNTGERVFFYIGLGHTF